MQILHIYNYYLSALQRKILQRTQGIKNWEFPAGHSGSFKTIYKNDIAHARALV